MKAAQKREERKKKMDFAIGWCHRTGKGYKAAVKEGIIEEKRRESLNKALQREKRDAEALSATLSADGVPLELPSAAKAAEARIKAMRENADQRMVCHSVTVCVRVCHVTLLSHIT